MLGCLSFESSGRGVPRVGGRGQQAGQWRAPQWGACWLLRSGRPACPARVCYRGGAGTTRVTPGRTSVTPPLRGRERRECTPKAEAARERKRGFCRGQRTPRHLQPVLSRPPGRAVMVPSSAEPSGCGDTGSFLCPRFHAGAGSGCVWCLSFM